jgi:hypothetical protein
MTHPTDDDLVLYHYGEAEDAALLEAHVAACAGCREVLASIEEALVSVTAAAAPARGPEYGPAVWERLQPSLGSPRHAPGRARWTAWTALAASLVLAFFLGRASHEREVHLATAALPPPPRERILLVAVGEHLERSRLVLLELENTRPQAAVDISSERGRAQELLSANRLYRQAAHNAGEPAVASVLEELERVLVEVATSPDEITASGLDEIQRRIEAQGIVFKLRVLGADVQRPRPPAVPTSSGSQS